MAELSQIDFPYLPHASNFLTGFYVPVEKISQQYYAKLNLLRSYPWHNVPRRFCSHLRRCLGNKILLTIRKGLRIFLLICILTFFLPSCHMQIFVTNFLPLIFTSLEKKKEFFIHQVCTFCPEEPQSVWERGSHLHRMKKKLFWFLFFAFVAASIFHENFNKNNIVVPRHLEEWNKLLRAEKHNCPVWI